jgi:trehalose/maltose hydrolase-like predicted phosphorylase
MLLTYPLGAILNISAEVSRADAELFIPITCLENAGMTTPMHTIVWLQLGEQLLAEQEFNRSLHAACYGPFNVRNEVDKHADMPGGHFDNTHFLTGDGGFLQALLNGYGGLRLEGAGLRLLAPALPGSVGELTLRAVKWRQSTLTLSVTVSQQTLQLLPGGPEAQLCLADAKGAQQVLQLGGPPLALDRASFAYPGLLTRCS